MKKTLLLLFAAVAVVSGCAQSQGTADTSSPSDDTSAPADNSNRGENTIVYTGSGFQPSTLTIQQGETATWVNEGDGPMWVASNVHPYHTQYAGTSLREHCSNGDQTSAAFDQCSTGESFSFTFEKTGEWSYHNHVASGGGTIIVN